MMATFKVMLSRGRSVTSRYLEAQTTAQALKLARERYPEWTIGDIWKRVRERRRVIVR